MKFNIRERSNPTLTNMEGERAYAMKPELELYTAVVTTSLSNSFYTSGAERMQRIRELIAVCDPVFVAKLTIYARTVMHLRSVPLYLVCCLAQEVSGSSLVSTVVEKIVLRADEITELLSCYAMFNERRDVKKLGRLSKQIQKGLAAAFNRFDEYQFAKYDRTASVTLRDALFLVHPKANTAEQQAIFDRIARGTLQVPYTWETELSVVGQRTYASKDERAAAVKAAWEGLIDSGRLGYMAMLRNLRNIVKANVSAAHIEAVCAVLSDPEQVRRSKQFPFRFLSAYRELLALQPVVHERTLMAAIMQMFNSSTHRAGGATNVDRLIAALEAAIGHTAAAITGFDANTRILIACDVSGSMQVPISQRSTVKNYDIGLVLAMLLSSVCKNATVGMFGDTWKIIPMPTSSILANVQEFYKREGEVGYATNGYLVVQDLIDRRCIVDKVMLFTDCQLWNSNGDGQHLQKLWTTYRQRVAPHATLYLFDLAGHGSAPLTLNENGVALIAGWNERIFEVMQAIEEGGTAIGAIEKVQI